MAELGEMLKARREELKMTLEDVGEKVGVGKSTVRKWENGIIKNMGRDKIAALAEALQIDPVTLVPAVKKGTKLIAINTLNELESHLIDVFRKADKRTRENALLLLENSAGEQAAKKEGQNTEKMA